MQTHPLPLPERDASLFILFGITCLLLFGSFFVLALFGTFWLPLLLICTLVLGSTALFLLVKFLVRTDWLGRAVLFATLLYAVLAVSFSPPTVFSGRDQGSISEAAIRLAQNGQLAFRFPASETFFNLYGPGLALNFPGFAYTGSGDLITQFPLVYTSFLAAGYAFFGLAGFSAANGILLFLFLYTLFQLLRSLVHPYFATLGVLLAGAGFLPLWFSKFTLTENLAVFLFTFLAYALLCFVRSGKFIAYAGAILTASLFAFTRIEGYAFALLTLAFLLSRPEGRDLWRRYPVKSIILPGLIFAFLFLRNFFMNLPYYKAMARAFVKFAGGFGSDVAGGSGASIFGSYVPVGGALILYGLLPLFMAGLVGALILWRKKAWLALLPLGLALPTFLYLFAPNITLDHPWMLRRYYFSLYPALLITAVLGIATLLAQRSGRSLSDAPSPRSRKAFLLFAGALVLLAVPAQSRFLLHQENRGLLSQTQAFAEKFSPNDLILMDSQVTGSGYAMPTGPLSALSTRQAVYFFNPADLETIDFARFAKAYLVVPEASVPRYAERWGERMIFQGSYTYSSQFLRGGELSDQARFAFPEARTQETRNLIFQLY